MIGDFPIQFSRSTNCLLHHVFLAWEACALLCTFLNQLLSTFLNQSFDLTVLKDARKFYVSCGLSQLDIKDKP